MTMKDATMPAGEFKARCLEVMDSVSRTRRSVVITKRGKPVVRLVPVAPAPAPLLGWARGEILGDITKPVVPLAAYETLREWDRLVKENPRRRRR
jgi:prevent-host-death family protein